MTEEQTSLISALSDALAAAVERAAASVVTVDARRRFPASGVVWAPGVVLTCDHVLERDEDVHLTLPDGQVVPAEVAGRDAGSDLAVLRTTANDLTPLARGGAVRVGHPVLAVGRPGPGGPMASFGVVAAAGGAWRTFRGGQVEGYVRADLTFYPGFSGGPLVNTAGAVVGLNSSRLGRGAGLTVPVEAAAAIAGTLLSAGRIRRGYLGVGSQAARLPAALAARVGGQQSALLIVGVEPGTPADNAGLLVGDLLVALGGAPVRDTDDLQAQLGPDSVGRELQVLVLRGGEPKTLPIAVGERS
ncbi:MAG: trypsin-like peptidase domain-containing protein [Dehalococcoidia bacterium]|nr:trypsin-like peptidase domain-containing protein [Dehalococcoidia bacterium]